MGDRPHIQNFAIWDCTELEIKRDPENDCVDIVCRGEDKFARLRITVWTGESKAPVVKIDQTLFSPSPPTPEPPSIEDMISDAVQADALVNQIPERE